MWRIGVQRWARSHHRAREKIKRKLDAEAQKAGRQSWGVGNSREPEWPNGARDRLHAIGAALASHESKLHEGRRRLNERLLREHAEHAFVMGIALPLIGDTIGITWPDGQDDTAIVLWAEYISRERLRLIVRGTRGNIGEFVKTPSEMIWKGNVESNAQFKNRVKADWKPRRWLAESKVFVLAFVVVALVAWMFRFDLKPSAYPRIAEFVYVLDRWTGNVYLVEVKNWNEVMDAPQERKDSGSKE